MSLETRAASTKTIVCQSCLPISSVICGSAMLRRTRLRLTAGSGALRRLRRFARMEADRPHRRARISLATLRKRIEQDFRGARAGGGALSLSLAGAGRSGGAESGEAGVHAEAAKETSARAHDRRNEFCDRWRDARSRGLSRARPADARTALRMRHPQFGTYRDQPRRHSA